MTDKKILIKHKKLMKKAVDAYVEVMRFEDNIYEERKASELSKIDTHTMSFEEFKKYYKVNDDNIVDYSGGEFGTALDYYNNSIANMDDYGEFFTVCHTYKEKFSSTALDETADDVMDLIAKKINKLLETKGIGGYGNIENLAQNIVYND